MTDRYRWTSDSNVTNEACAWITQIETGDLKHQDVAGFREWMARSPAHRKEIYRWAKFSEKLCILSEMSQPLKNAAERHRDAHTATRFHRWFGVRHYAAFGVILVVLFLGDGMYQKQALNETRLITTQMGVREKVILSDGSMIELNTNSEIEVNFNEQQRNIRLVRGEISFKVAHNKNRPFVVYAGESFIRAVGTAFVVEYLDDVVEVIVTEGRVELGQTEIQSLNSIATPNIEQQVNGPDKRKRSNVYLSEGEGVSYIDVAQNDDVEAIPKKEIERKLSWQQGFIEFHDAPLVDVINDLKRYTPLQVEISSDELRGLRFGGIFKLDELPVLFGMLETYFDIDVEYQNSGAVRLSRNETDEI
jgi:transmembrane sensor